MIKSSRESLVIHEAQFYRYFNLTFGSWDFCITDPNSADLKKMNIYIDMQVSLVVRSFTTSDEPSFECASEVTILSLNNLSLSLPPSPQSKE